MFAGDIFKPAADASYRNFLWENFHLNHSFDIGTKVLENKEIGTIDSWGPFFRVSFDLIIHSLGEINQLAYQNWYSVLAFVDEIGSELPVIELHSLGFLRFRNIFVNYSTYYNSVIFNIKLNQWYNIMIDQKSVNGKVIRENKINIGNISIFRDIILLQLMGT